MRSECCLVILKNQPLLPSCLADMLDSTPIISWHYLVKSQDGYEFGVDTQYLWKLQNWGISSAFLP